jgi:hypothetical protein
MNDLAYFLAYVAGDALSGEAALLVLLALLLAVSDLIQSTRERR